MVICNQKDWIDILSALLAPSIVLFGAIVAGMEWWINHKRLKNELFDRRIAVYDIISNYMSSVFTTGCIEREAETKFLSGTKNVYFLFGSDVKEFIDEIFKKSSDLHVLEKMQSNLSGTALENNMNKQGEIINWFKKEFDGLEERFKRHLSL